MEVIKRDGSREEWQSGKLETAIKNAAADASEAIEDITPILIKISHKVACPSGVVDVSVLHKAVEDTLMTSRYKATARKYIEKRSQRDSEREGRGKLLQDLTGFLEQTSEDFLKENANKPAAVVTSHRDLIAGIVSKHLALSQILSEDVAEAHQRGVIHQHDLDYVLSPLTNCCLVNYQDMLENGFCIGDAKIESPRSIGTAATILTQIAQAVASSQYGGQSHAHIDSGLKKYVQRSWQKIKEEQLKYSLPDEWAMEKIEKEVYDAMQSLLYQINSLTTTNGQTPFQTISMGLDTSWEGRLITEQYLKVHTKGLGKDGITPTFPKVVFFLQDGVNMREGDVNYDLKQLAVKCAARRIYPDWVYVPTNQLVTGSDIPVTPMGCRSFLSKWVDENGNEKLDGRFNIGVVSLNLPYIVLEAKEAGEDFYAVLNKYAFLARKAHMERVERLRHTKAKTNPTMWVHGVLARLDPEDEIEKVLFDGRASISVGYVGLYEAVTLLCGGEDKEMGLEILTFLKSLCEQWKKEDKLGWSLYGTPSESLCYKAATSVKRDFGDKVISKPYLTNSFHYPVWEKVHVQDKWGYEKGFELVSNGGNIVYIEVPNLERNLEAYEGLIDYACHIGLHYFALNTPVDQCFECGYHGEFAAHLDGYECPSCGNKDSDSISVLRRVSGYISAPNSRPFNKGKQSEVIDRVKHK